MNVSTESEMGTEVDGSSASESGHSNETADYWKRKCMSLKKQVDMLTAANKSLGEQLQTRTREVRTLTRVLEKVKDDNEEKLVSSRSFISALPEELWEIILEYVTEPQDLLHARLVSNQWNDVLHPNKGTWMFSPIVKHIFKYLTLKDVLRCRLICKKWNKAIDTFLENHPSKRPFLQNSEEGHDQDEKHLKSMKLTNSVTFHLWDAERLRTLRSEMGRHPRNPFVGRSVVFNVEIDDDFEDDEDFDDRDPGIGEFWTLAKLFLNTTGIHIWYVEITEDSGHQKPLEFYKLLRELLIWMPNLKSLKVAVDISHDDYYPKSLSLFMGSNALPVMPHLESLNVECFYPEVPQIIHDLLIYMYSPQLKKLHINMTRWKSSYPRGFTKLTELHVKSVHLGKLARLEAPSLGKISIDLRESGISAQQISTHLLFETLARFPLNILILHVDIAVELEEISEGAIKRCSIPTLEKLEIVGVQRKILYGFLLCFPSLKYLNIRESTSGDRFNEDPAVVAFLEGNSLPKSEVVEVHKYLYKGRMYKSNIWRKIPSLRVFTYEKIRYGIVEFRQYCNREMYEFRCAKKTGMSNKNKLPVVS